MGELWREGDESNGVTEVGSSIDGAWRCIANVEKGGVVGTLHRGVQKWAFGVRPEKRGRAGDGARFEGGEDLSKFFIFDCWQCRPESSDSMCGIISCNIIKLVRIAFFVFEMGKVKSVGTVGVKLQETRGNYIVFEIYGFTADVAISFQYKPSLVGNDKVVVNKLAIEYIATICEERKPARHVERFVNDKTGALRVWWRRRGSVMADSLWFVSSRTDWAADPQVKPGRCLAHNSLRSLPQSALL